MEKQDINWFVGFGTGILVGLVSVLIVISRLIG